MSRKSLPSPELAREILSLDGASSDDSDGLEIVMSAEEKPPVASVAAKSKAAFIATRTKTNTTNNSAKKKKQAWDSSDDSEDDEELFAMALARPVAASIAAKKRPPAPKKTPSPPKRSRKQQPSSKNTQVANNTNPYGNSKKRLQRIQALEARLQNQQATKERKEREKLERAQQRQEQRQAKEQQRQLEKESKKRQKEVADQASGKYAHQEMVVLMDPDIYTNTEYALVETFAEDFLLHPYTSALTCSKAVQWIRKDYLQGGAEEALKRLEQTEGEHYEHLPHLMLILEGDDFLPLLQRADHDQDSDFPKLQSWLDSLVSRWQLVWKTKESPKILLLLHKIPEALDLQWVHHRRQKHSTTPPTEWEFQDATQWLLIQFQVECVLCPSIESIQSNFHKMTRGFAEAPYADQVTELQCIKKIKQSTSCQGDDFSKAKDVWTRQLQMLPGLSELMARNLTDSYPTLFSLWKAYQRGNDNDDGDYNKELVAGEFSKDRRMVKLSKSLHRVMTSDNPNEMVL